MTLIVLIVLLVSALVVNAGVSMHNPFYCYSTDPIRPLTRMHSTETSYEAVYRPSIDPNIALRRGFGFYSDMAVKMINLAESSILADIANNYDAGRTTLCRQDFEAIRNWTKDPNITMENVATPTEGNRVGMMNIARRYQQYFPTLLTRHYSRDRFHFRHVSSSATNASLRAFASGLFGETESANVVFENVPAFDSFLLPISFCPALTEETANQHQLAAFREGPEFEEMMEQVNRKLGFHGSNQLSVDRILAMSEWCRRETMEQFALSNPNADIPWCSPFSIAHFRLLEYFTDLRYFYLAGYGVRNQRLVENLNCGLVQDLLTHMRAKNKKKNNRDEWLLHQHNFAEQSARLWLTSLITTSTGNVVVVRYDCADGNHDLLFLLNERPLLIPGCGTENGICKLSFILGRFQRFVKAKCDKLFCSDD